MKYLYGIAIIICLILTSAISLAEPAAGERAKEGELLLTRFYSTPITSFERIKFGGSLKFTNYTYPQAAPNTDIRTSNRLIFKANMDARLDEHIQLFGQMRLRTDLPQSTVRTQVIPQEAYLNVNTSHVNFRGGYQIFSWGASDLYNPTDILNPRDYTDIFDFEKVGIVATKLTFSKGNFVVEGIWMPIPLEAYLPYQDSRFVQPFLTIENNPVFPIIGAPPADYDVTENYLDPPINIRSSQFGARVLATVGRFDLGLSYFNGYIKVPHQEIIAGRPDPQTGVIPVTVNHVYFREHLIGFNIAAGFKGLNLKSESALVIPYKTTHDLGGADDLHFIYTLGADYTFFELFGSHDFSINLEFAHRLNSETLSEIDFGNLFQKTLFARLEYKFSEFLKVRFSAIYNFYDRSYYLQPEIAWEPIDDLELKLGGNVLDGPSDSLFGLFDNQDRIYTSAQFFF
jgi:hypothetical protein